MLLTYLSSIKPWNMSRKTSFTDDIQLILQSEVMLGTTSTLIHLASCIGDNCHGLMAHRFLWDEWGMEYLVYPEYLDVLSQLVAANPSVDEINYIAVSQWEKPG